MKAWNAHGNQVDLIVKSNPGNGLVFGRIGPNGTDGFYAENEPKPGQYQATPRGSIRNHGVKPMVVVGVPTSLAPKRSRRTTGFPVVRQFSN